MADNTEDNPARQAAEAVQTGGRATSDAIRRGGEVAALVEGTFGGCSSAQVSPTVTPLATAWLPH